MTSTLQIDFSASPAFSWATLGFNTISAFYTLKKMEPWKPFTGGGFAKANYIGKSVAVLFAAGGLTSVLTVALHPQTKIVLSKTTTFLSSSFSNLFPFMHGGVFSKISFGHISLAFSGFKFAKKAYVEGYKGIELKDVLGVAIPAGMMAWSILNPATGAAVGFSSMMPGFVTSAFHNLTVYAALYGWQVNAAILVSSLAIGTALGATDLAKGVVNSATNIGITYCATLGALSCTAAYFTGMSSLAVPGVALIAGPIIVKKGIEYVYKNAPEIKLDVLPAYWKTAPYAFLGSLLAAPFSPIGILVVPAAMSTYPAYYSAKGYVNFTINHPYISSALMSAGGIGASCLTGGIAPAIVGVGAALTTVAAEKVREALDFSDLQIA